MRNVFWCFACSWRYRVPSPWFIRRSFESWSCVKAGSCACSGVVRRAGTIFGIEAWGRSSLSRPIKSRLPSSSLVLPFSFDCIPHRRYSPYNLKLGNASCLIFCLEKLQLHFASGLVSQARANNMAVRKQLFLIAVLTRLCKGCCATEMEHFLYLLQSPHIHDAFQLISKEVNPLMACPSIDKPSSYLPIYPPDP